MFKRRFTEEQRVKYVNEVLESGSINVKTILNNCANIFMYNCSIIFIRYFG